MLYADFGISGCQLSLRCLPPILAFTSKTRRGAVSVKEFILGAPTSLEMVTAAIKLKDVCSLEENL